MPPIPEATLDDWANALSEQLDRSVLVRRNEMELREDVHSLIQQGAAELFGLNDLATTGERL